MTPSRRRVCALVVTLTLSSVLVTACSSDDLGAPPITPTGAPTNASTNASTAVATRSASAASSSGRHVPSARQIVDDPHSVLSGARVVAHGRRLVVTAVWGLAGRHSYRYAVARSTDGFRTRRLSPLKERDIAQALGTPRLSGAGGKPQCAGVVDGTTLCVEVRQTLPPVARWTTDDGATWSRHRLALGHLMPNPAVSLRASTFAVFGGGDGATLFPFQRVTRSTDDGATWSASDLPLFDGARAYAAGQVVLPDGRALVLLDVFSDDRPPHRFTRPHGLYVSDDDDWSRFAPLATTFDPPLPAQDARGFSPFTSLAADLEGRPVITLQVGTDRLYVSTDDARSFHEVAVR